LKLQKLNRRAAKYSSSNHSKLKWSKGNYFAAPVPPPKVAFQL